MVRRQLARADLVLQTSQDAIKSAVPFLEYFSKIPSGRLEGGRLDGVEGMEGSDKRSDDGFIVFDKEGFEGEQELIDVGELEDALICDLEGGIERAFRVTGRVDTYDKDELEVVYKGPLDGVAIPFVFFVGSSALDEGFADEGVDWGHG